MRALMAATHQGAHQHARCTVQRCEQAMGSMHQVMGPMCLSLRHTHTDVYITAATVGMDAGLCWASLATNGGLV